MRTGSVIGDVRVRVLVALAAAVSALAAVGTVPALASESGPSASSATPAYVSAAGGQPVVVRGAGLTAVTDVTLLGIGYEEPVAGWAVVSDTELHLTTPRLPAGQVRVLLHAGERSVITDAGLSAQNVTAVAPARALELPRTVAGAPLCFSVKGRFGVHADAEAVMLNVTTVAPDGPGHVVVYPDIHGNGQTPAPWASTVNFIPGRDVANATFVGTTGNGDVCVLTRGAPAGLLVDVMGFQAPDGPFFLHNRPQRTVDTRPDSAVGDLVGPLRPRETYEAYIGPSEPGPVGGLALLNVTIPGPPAAGNLRMFAPGSAVPPTSTANFLPGADRATLALTPTSGQVSAFWSDSAQPAHVVVDHIGATLTWAPSSFAAGSSVQVSGRRVVDTRPETRTGPFTDPLRSGAIYRLPVTALTDRPETSRAALLSVIAVAPTTAGHLRVFADESGASADLPSASAVNYLQGSDTSNLVLVDLPRDGTVSFYSGQPAGGFTHLVVDVVAYLGAPVPFTG